MDVLRERLSDSLRALGDVFANPNLRRVELASAGSVVAYWSYGVALAVFAYREGGPAAVGLLGLVRMLPSAFGAPFTALLGDRYPRQRVMLGADVVSAVAVGVSAGAIAADAPAAIVFGLAGLVQLISTASAPARSALLPSLARSPEELTAANVASTTIESVGSFAGPALAGILLAFADLAVVVGLTAGAFLWSALLVARIATDPRPPRGRDDRDGLVREALAGFRAIGAEPDLRLLVGLYAAQTFVAGALSVLIVVMALELLDLGEAGVGFLNSAIGVGGLLGAVAALALVGRRRLVADFRLGLVLWGLPIVLVGVWPDPTLAVLFLAVLGAGNTIVDVAGLTLLQRAVEDRVLARVFGVFESLTWATIGLGAVVAPIAIAGLGDRGALIAVGAFLPALAALSWRRLSRIAPAAGPVGAPALLRSVPIFAPLPAATIERLASAVTQVRLVPGEQVFAEGDPGDRFYVIAAGEVQVVVAGRPARALGPGESFGEIALLRDVPRTATVTASSETEALALEREDFIAVVTGHPASAAAANSVIAARLGALRPSAGLL